MSDSVKVCMNIMHQSYGVGSSASKTFLWTVALLTIPVCARKRSESSKTRGAGPKGVLWLHACLMSHIFSTLSVFTEFYMLKVLEHITTLS
jgi:hypothetical protein